MQRAKRAFCIGDQEHAIFCKIKSDGLLEDRIREALNVQEEVTEEITSQADDAPLDLEDDFNLQTQTEEELAQQEADRKARAEAEAKQKAKDETEAKRKKDEQNTKARADDVVDDFQLGQSSDEAMSGMGDMFSQPEQQEVGAFGLIFRQFRHDARGAIEHLRKQQAGEAIAALHHPDVGDIDLVWGKEGTAAREYEDGMGLAKIIKKHSEVLDDLQGFVGGLSVQKRSKNRVVLSDGSGKALVRLDWDGESKHWLLTAYDDSRKAPVTGEGRTGVSAGAESAPPADQGTEAEPSIPQAEKLAQPKTGTHKVTAHGVTVTVPTISKELNDDYNRVTHMGKGRDFNAELEGEAKSIIEDLAGRKHTIETDAQKAKAAELIERYLGSQADFLSWEARHSVNNPSWFVTGRGGRNMAKTNKANERHMDQYGAKVERLDTQRKDIAKTLYDMRPESVKSSQANSRDLKEIAQLAGDILSYIEADKPVLTKETRGWASPKAHKLMERALDADREGAVKYIQELDAVQAVQDAGGLATVFGPRSKAGKLVTELLGEHQQEAKQKEQAEAEQKPAWEPSRAADSGVIETRKTEDGNTALFSRGVVPDVSAATRPVLEHDAVKAIVERTAEGLGFGAGLSIHDSEQALFSAVPVIGKQADKDGANGQIRAVHYRGEVHVVASAFAREADVEMAILDALAHEGQGHYGIRMMYGSDMSVMNDALRDLYGELGGMNGVRRMAESHGIDMRLYFKTAESMGAAERASYLTDELLAHLQGKAATASLPQKLKAAIRAYLGAVREWLRNHGFVNLAGGTDADITLLLKRMREASRRKPTGRGLAARFVRAQTGLDVIKAEWQESGIEAFVSERNGVINLSKIVVPKASRSAGAGTRAMQQLTDYADSTGQRIELTPSADFGGNKARLTEFYKRFGFVENRGRNKNYEISEAMYREPASGVRFSFAGEKSGTAMHQELARAKWLTAKGMTSEEVRQETGWHRGNDGKWRYEISDHEAKLKADAKTMGEVIDLATLNAIAEGRNRSTIGDVLEHDALFRAYPHLAEIPVIKLPNPKPNSVAAVGMIDGEFVVALNPQARGDYAVSALLHELQHAIQRFEGFARGGNSAMAARLQGLDALDKKAANAYMRLQGEIEARNTQARRRMDDNFRKLFAPAETQDIQDKDAIVTFNGSELEDLTQAPAISRQEVRDVFAAQFPKLAKAIDRMLERGDKRQSGGLVILNSADPLMIARQYSDITGTNLSHAIRVFDNAEGAQGFFDQKSGLIFLVGPSVNTGNVASVILHEALHSQQHKLVDDKAMDMLINRKHEKNANTKAFLDRVVRRMSRSQGGVTHPEAAAYIVETALMEGRDGSRNTAVDGKLMDWIESNLGKGIADLIRSFATAYRQFALRNGLGVKVNVDDLIQYAQASMKKSARAGAAPYDGGTGGGVRRSATKRSQERSASAEGERQFSETERAYGGRAAYDKAKAAGKTKLNYQQWVQVRTPAFKEWFGDWETASSGPERKASNFTEARQAAKAFQGTPLTNHGTGIVATVSRNNLDKMLSQKAVGKSASPELHSAAVANLDSMFERAVLGWSKPDSEGDPNIKAIHRFFTPVLIDGKAMMAKMTVKETVQDARPNPLYTVEAVSFEELKNPAAQWVGEIAEADGIDPRTTRSAGLVESMAQNVQQFNTANVSKVTDPETGEPMVVYHGTTGDFDSFDNKKTGANDRGLWGKGHYFASNPEVANSYALRQGYGANVVPAFVSIRNPLTLKTGTDLVTRLPDGTNHRDLLGQNLDGSKIKGIAESGGHDGVIQIKPDGLIGDLVAYDGGQIKSASGNVGTFSADTNDIRFSRKASAKSQPATNGPEVLAGPLASRFDDIVYKLQDKHIDLKRVIQEIRKTTGGITDALDTYLQETLFHGRAAKRTQDFVRHELGDLTRAMQQGGITMEAMEEYLHARHAQEANEVLAERNPNQAMIDAGLARANATITWVQEALDADPRNKDLKRELKDAQLEAKKWRTAKPFKGTEAERNSLSGMSNAEAQANLSEVQYHTQAFGAQVDAWKAKASANVAHAEMQSRFADMNTRTSIAYAEMQITEFQAHMQKAVQEAQIALEAAKALGQFTAQLAAGAMSAAHVSASIGASGSATDTRTKTDTTTTTTSHNYNY